MTFLRTSYYTHNIFEVKSALSRFFEHVLHMSCALARLFLQFLHYLSSCFAALTDVLGMYGQGSGLSTLATHNSVNSNKVT